jgi:hypothetical protein
MGKGADFYRVAVQGLVAGAGAEQETVADVGWPDRVAGDGSQSQAAGTSHFQRLRVGPLSWDPASWSWAWSVRCRSSLIRHEGTRLRVSDDRS